jgi:hypothetical protein
MVELRESIEVPASAEVVWRAFTDWERQGDWMLLTRVRSTTAEREGPGAGIEGITGVGPLVVRDPMVVRTWDPPRRCIVRHTGRVVRGAGVFEVEPLGPESSLFTWGEVLEIPLGALGRAGFPLVRPAVSWGLRVSLRRFASWVPRWATTATGR